MPAKATKREASFQRLPPVRVARSLAEAKAALAPGAPVTLLSAPGAGLYAGPLWWLTLVTAARRAYPDTPVIDLLDCADGTTQAWAGLRLGLTGFVLSRGAPARSAFVLLARARRARLLAVRPA